MKKVLGILALIVSVSANAEFVIQRGGEKGQVGLQKISDSKARPVIDDLDTANLDMILDGRYAPVKEHGDARDDAVGGVGSGVPLSQGIRLLAPDGFTVYKSPQVDSDAVKLSWTNGENLTEVLERAGSEHNVMFEIDWDKEVIAIRPGQPKLLALNAEDGLALEIADALEEESTGITEPAVLSGVDLEAPIEIFDLYQGEHLRNLAPRVARRLGLKRSVMDFAESSPDPSMVRTSTSLQIEYKDRTDLLNKLNREFAPGIDKLEFRIAQDGFSEQALVLSTREHANWTTLFIFDVRRGTLRDSAMRLAQLFGYSSTSELWMLDHDWPIPYDYPIVVTDAAQAYERLFERYPAQAQLASGAKEVVFVPRIQPKLNNGEPRNTRASLEDRK